MSPAPLSLNRSASSDSLYQFNFEGSNKAESEYSFKPSPIHSFKPHQEIQFQFNEAPSFNDQEELAPEDADEWEKREMFYPRSHSNLSMPN